MFDIVSTIQPSNSSILHYYFFTEEVERREKALADELELIESQVNYGKHQQQFDGIAAPSQTDEVPHAAVEEGEENRDPNPDPKASNDQLSIKVDQSLDIAAKLESDDLPLLPIVESEIIKPDDDNDKTTKEEAELDEEIEEEEEEERVREEENNG